MTQPEAHLCIESMCRLGQVSRAGFFRGWRERQPKVEEAELRSQIQRIVVEHRQNYGVPWPSAHSRRWFN